MRRTKTPKWVRTIDAMASYYKQPPWGPPVPAFQMLSDLVGRVEFHCALCNRHGRYRVDKLLAEFGDQPMIDLPFEIAMKGGCNRALHPPTSGDISYNDHVCQIRRYYSK